jgi:hypothetical protein
MHSVGVKIITYAVWLTATVLIIRYDAKRQAQKARERGEVDFADRSVMNYLVLSIFCGPAPLIVYFGVTRKTFGGWVLGFAVAAATMVLLVIIGTIGTMIAR